MSVDFASVLTMSSPDGVVKQIANSSNDILWKQRTLSEMTWQEISIISNAGLASSCFSIGETKSVSVNGVSYPARIIGFDHDTLVQQTGGTVKKAGITMQLVDCLNTKYPINSSSGGGAELNNLSPVSSTYSTITGSAEFSTTTMYNTTLNAIYNMLDQDLQNVIRSVSKSSITSSYRLTSISSLCFLPSITEISGKKNNNRAEGAIYEYYDLNPRDVIKNVNLTASKWWTRSWCGAGEIISNTNYYYSVNNTLAGGLIAGFSESDDTLSLGVSFCFCI